MSSSDTDKPEPIIFGDRDLSDVTLVVEDQEFLVHKMVLASRSDVFKAMFYGDFKEAKENRVEIKEVAAATFQRLLELLYCGRIKDRHKLFPSFCNNSASDFSAYKQQAVEGIWSFDSCMFQLLKVADRFNLLKTVYPELKDVFLQIPCTSNGCFRCMSIYLFLLDSDATFKPLYRKFDRHIMATAAKTSPM